MTAFNPKDCFNFTVPKIGNVPIPPDSFLDPPDPIFQSPVLNQPWPSPPPIVDGCYPLRLNVVSNPPSALRGQIEFVDGDFCQPEILLEANIISSLIASGVIPGEPGESSQCFELLSNVSPSLGWSNFDVCGSKNYEVQVDEFSFNQLEPGMFAQLVGDGRRWSILITGGEVGSVNFPFKIFFQVPNYLIRGSDHGTVVSAGNYICVGGEVECPTAWKFTLASGDSIHNAGEGTEDLQCIAHDGSGGLPTPQSDNHVIVKKPPDLRGHSAIRTVSSSNGDVDQEIYPPYNPGDPIYAIRSGNEWIDVNVDARRWVYECPDE